jgi:hypothetical protein
MLGGPTSGHDLKLVNRVHQDKKFKRSSPSPDQIFDNVRGASVPINSYNCISQFMPGDKEAPRRTILQNFQEINRIVTSNFLKNKNLEQKYKNRIPRDVLQKKELEDIATQNMTQLMKKMHSPRNFTSPLARFGQP